MQLAPGPVLGVDSPATWVSGGIRKSRPRVMPSLLTHLIPVPWAPLQGVPG